jgi:hypothetical protein
MVLADLNLKGVVWKTICESLWFMYPVDWRITSQILYKNRYYPNETENIFFRFLKIVPIESKKQLLYLQAIPHAELPL